MIREALKILAALLENCASAINERLDPPLTDIPSISLQAAHEFHVAWMLARMEDGYEPGLMWMAANDETITRH